jgi:hypothetical protein
LRVRVAEFAGVVDDGVDVEAVVFGAAGQFAEFED